MLNQLQKAVIAAANPRTWIETEDATKALLSEFRKKANVLFVDILSREEEAKTAAYTLLKEERLIGLWDGFTALTGIGFSEKAISAVLAYKAEMDAKSYVWGDTYIRKYGGCPADFYLDIYLRHMAQVDKALKKLHRRKSIA
jgi:hypothetical protein